jgi:proteasome regulatory subunit
MASAQHLLVRSILAAFAERPYEEGLVKWGTSIHDKFLLPHFVRRDFSDALAFLGDRGFTLNSAWFDPHFEFRFPYCGEIVKDDKFDREEVLAALNEVDEAPDGKSAPWDEQSTITAKIEEIDSMAKNAVSEGRRRDDLHEWAQARYDYIEARIASQRDIDRGTLETAGTSDSTPQLDEEPESEDTNAADQQSRSETNQSQEESTASSDSNGSTSNKYAQQSIADSPQASSESDGQAGDSEGVTQSQNPSPRQHNLGAIVEEYQKDLQKAGIDPAKEPDELISELLDIAVAWTEVQTQLEEAPVGGESPEERLEALRDHFEEIVRVNEQLSEQLEDTRSRQEELSGEVDQLERENETLKTSSLYIATAEELTEDGVVVKQHGNNQEVLTEVSPSIRERLEAGDRVAINDSFSVKQILDPETDARAQAMQVEHSPDVTYADIGGLEAEMNEVREAVEEPLLNAQQFRDVGIEPPSGVLLHGPPGTGKTMLAKAVANETDATFIKMAGSELVRKFIGEGARLVRDLFELASERQPAIIFIDEIDAIAAKRTDSKTSGDAEVQRTMMQLLSEMDGFDDRGEIRIIAATNRFDMLDRAILRPGRFDRLIEVPNPDVAGRERILEIHTEEMNLADDVNLGAFADETEGLSGAELASLTTEAGMFAIRDSRTVVEQEDFHDALAKITQDEETGSQPVAFA